MVWGKYTEALLEFQEADATQKKSNGTVLLFLSLSGPRGALVVGWFLEYPLL